MKKVFNNISYHAIAVLLWARLSLTFKPSTLLSPKNLRFNDGRKTKLFAENGPPKYDKFNGIISEAEVVGKGSVMLHIEAERENIISEIGYKPGHVLALEMEDVTGETKDNDGWMRGPYTVSRIYPTSNSFDILIKVVGKKSNAFAAVEANKTPVKFGGKFKVPILDGIEIDAGSVERGDEIESKVTKKIILISTGVGIGPCIGAVELALGEALGMEPQKQTKKFPPIELYASFRTKDEVIYEDYLNQLSAKHPKQFQWTPITSSDTGRISKSVQNLQKYIFKDDDIISYLQNTHYHLIGNGQMVNEFKTGLSNAGVLEDKITTESYFNHKEPTDESVIKGISNALSNPTSSSDVGSLSESELVEES